MRRVSNSAQLWAFPIHFQRLCTMCKFRMELAIQLFFEDSLATGTNLTIHAKN